MIYGHFITHLRTSKLYTVVLGSMVFMNNMTKSLTSIRLQSSGEHAINNTNRILGDDVQVT